MLSAREVSELTGWPVRTVRYKAQTGTLPAESVINDRNRKEYLFFLESLPRSAQEEHYARQRAELAAPADASSASTAKVLKPFDCYTEAEREEIVFWKRVLADWEKYRQRGGMNAAELDKRFLAYLALEYPDRKLSIATLYRKRKALAEGDLDGLVDGRGKGRKGKRSMPEPVWTFFRGALLQETKHMDIREAMRQTEEHFQLTDPDMLPLPSYSTFRRRVLEDIPPQVLCLGIYGEKALKDEFVPFVRRDYHGTNGHVKISALHRPSGGRHTVHTGRRGTRAAPPGPAANGHRVVPDEQRRLLCAVRCELGPEGAVLFAGAPMVHSGDGSHA